MRKLIYKNEKGQEVTLSNSQPFYLLKIENTSSSSSSVTYSSRDNGYDIDNISIKEKAIPITCAIDADSKEDLDRKRRYLTNIFNPLISGELILELNGIIRKINIHIDSITFSNPIGSYQEFLIQVTAPIPFWKDLHIQKTTIALWEGNFEFEFGVEEEGVDLGYRVSNLICNVKNNGDVNCGMKIQFNALATVVNPSLININTREFIRINKTLEKGDLLEVTTEYANKKIELIHSNGTRENVYNWIDLDSEFLQLDLGDNLFRYDADNGIDNLEIAIYHTNLYLGV